MLTYDGKKGKGDEAKRRQLFHSSSKKNTFADEETNT
jgi:hypothetical protein